MIKFIDVLRSIAQTDDQRSAVAAIADVDTQRAGCYHFTVREHPDVSISIWSRPQCGRDGYRCRNVLDVMLLRGCPADGWTAIARPDYDADGYPIRGLHGLPATDANVLILLTQGLLINNLI